MIYKVGNRKRGVHQFLKYRWRDDPKFTVALRLNGDVKLKILQHAGSREHAGISVKQTVNGNFPAFFRIDVGPKLAGYNKNQPQTIAGAIVDCCSFFNDSAGGRRSDKTLFFNR